MARKVPRAGKKGKHLEESLNMTNNIYKHKGYAVVDKIPTPWNVNYNPKKRINQAFPEEKGTVDYIGVAGGAPVAFEAKTSYRETRFDLANIADHQVRYLLDFQRQGGCAFVIILFDDQYEFYYLELDQLLAWWRHQRDGGRKSIPYEWVAENCPLIKSGNGAPLNYLPFIAKERVHHG